MKNYIYLFGLILLTSCNESNNEPNNRTLPGSSTATENNYPIDSLNAEEENNTLEVLEIPEKNDQLNDIALLISGIKVDSNSKYFSQTTTKSWVKYSSKLNNTWGKIKTNRLKKMDEWEKKELHESVTQNRVGIYPFSGPDFLTFYTFFNDAPSYYMFGLEPLGNVPDLKFMSQDSIGLYYRGMEDATEDLLNLTFFRTNWMKTELKKNGVIPIILYFLARTDNAIYSVEKLDIDSSGNLVNDPTGKSSKVAHIKFIDSKTKKLKDIYYLSADVSNYALNKHPEILNYLNNIPSGNSYLKAASYLCHHSYMTKFRTFILNKSKLVLQEDSGIPYKFFPKEKWGIKLYGKYVNPYRIFTDKIYVQENLRNDFKNPNLTNPLPFRLGYHSGTRNDNLMLAVLK